ncbi:MAG: CoA-binding protein, partial [Desulfobacteraceae bacterium]|nr:CoA-binding protein [Desulfobacteraceae bacterium]
MDLKCLFKPSTMAVVGVSTSQDNHPANVIYNKNHLRYPVKTFPVNPRGGLINRAALYKSVEHIEEDVDMAVIAVRSEYVPEVLEQCIKKGVGGAVIISGGFAESGNLALQQRIID